jgi:hypothetical protein
VARRKIEGTEIVFGLAKIARINNVTTACLKE